MYSRYLIWLKVESKNKQLLEFMMSLDQWQEYGLILLTAGTR